jgi:hypothetical protein
LYAKNQMTLLGSINKVLKGLYHMIYTYVYLVLNTI